MDSPISSGFAPAPADYSRRSSESAVAAADFSPVFAAVMSSEEGEESNVSKKPAWNKQTNGGGGEVSPVMGAVTWPALSESTKASPKGFSLSDGSVSVSQGMGMGSSSPRQASNNNAYPNSTLNHGGATRQRSMKRGGGFSNNNASANGGISQQSASESEIAPNISGAESSSRNSPRDGGQRGGFSSQSHSGGERQHQRSFNRRGFAGQHPRGDGTYHHGYGGRRDQERGNQDWSPRKGWGNRDAHAQPQRGPARPFIRGPPHTSPPFIPPPMPMQPYQTPIVYPDVPPVFYIPGPHPDSLRMPVLAPIPPVFFHIPDPQLHTKLVNQIDYYFSNENLIKDTFLRQNMDEHGWVPVTLIAGFKKVMQLADNIHLILDAMRSSTIVEVQGVKLRRRNDWHRWIMSPSVSSPQSLQKSSPDVLSENFRNLSFDDRATGHVNADSYISQSSSTELSSPSKPFGNEMTGGVGDQHTQPMNQWPVGNPS